MPGIPGPPPKRTSERRRTNTTTESGVPNEAEVVEISDKMLEENPPVEAGEPGEHWGEVPRKMWDSALKSGQRIFYEPSDWATLYMLCEELHLETSEKVIGFSEKDGELVYAIQPMQGAKFTALMRGFSSLMFMEGDRRKLRLELERNAVKDPTVTQPGDVVAFRQRRLG